jgi:hypothetical protein
VPYKKINAQPTEHSSKALVIEVTDPMYAVLVGLQKTGLFGPSVETAAQRVLEMWIFDFVTATTTEIKNV